MDLSPIGDKADVSEFSPHTWGWTLVLYAKKDATDVFPTHVGMDLADLLSERKIKSFPHTLSIAGRSLPVIVGLCLPLMVE